MSTIPEIRGVITALITPFKNGQVDHGSLKRLVEHQLANGINGFVINGTTGESPTLHDTEISEIFKTVKAIVGDKVPLILGTGTNNTVTTIEKTLKAKDLGALAALVVTPYYNRPPQAGIIAHYKKLTDAIDFPIIPYNVPPRTGVTMTLETILTLSRLKNIIGIKEASGDMNLAKIAIEATNKESQGRFKFLSGDDMTYAQMLALGGHGVISVASHILPAEFTKLQANATNTKDLQQMWEKTKPAVEALNIGVNPIPIKYAVYKMGLIASPELRLPLVELGEADATTLTQALKACGVVSG